MKNVFTLFRKFQLKNKNFLSRHKFLYALLAGAGVVLYWRGIWNTVDYLESVDNIFFKIIFSSIGTLILGILLLSSIGVLIQELVGSDVIISSLKKEKTDIEKTEDELIKEEEENKKERDLIKEIDKHLHNLEKEIKNN